MGKAQESKETEQVLEEAPGAKGDIRVPMLPRAAATKRVREATSPERDSKWQAIEEEAGAKRSLEDSNDEDRSKFQAVADNGGPPAENLSSREGPLTTHPGPKDRRE